MTAPPPAPPPPATSYSSHQVMFQSNPLYFAVLVILIPALGLGLVGFAIWFVQARSMHLQVQNGIVVFTTGLLSKERVEFATASIRSIKVEQSVLERWTGAGTIRITTAGDTPEVVATGMPDVERLQRVLKA